MLSLLLLSSSALAAAGSELRIHNANELIKFSDSVNTGLLYTGTTVLLDSDIVFTDELSQQFIPIGKDDGYYFLGTFDGQGHVISNLTANSYTRYAGLFGYSKGATFKNFVLGDSSSVISSGDSPYSSVAHAGGIIGYCIAIKGPCNFEGVVNMASVTFSGKLSDLNDDLYIGGLSGILSSSFHESVVKNCANYGSVTQSGQSGLSHIGGIFGSSNGFSTWKNVRVQNCLNYGTIAHRGKTLNYFVIGGIIGRVQSNDIDNCANYGVIESHEYDSHAFIGGIVGTITHSSISHSYWSGHNRYDAYSSLSFVAVEGIAKFGESFELNETVSVGAYTGASLLDALNAAADHYRLRDYSHWLLNRNESAVAFTMNSARTPITLSAQLILLPGLADDGSLHFNGWYTDSECREPLADFVVSADMELYGKYGIEYRKYAIIFDLGGESSTSQPMQVGTVVELPTSSKKTNNCTVAFWENEHGDREEWNFTVPARNVTLHAVWLCTYITTPEELVDFSKIASSGSSCLETTVYLDSDLDFTPELSQRFRPIGKHELVHFRGTFDGQGHTISNLAVSSPAQFVGLFGYTGGEITIRGVVLDSTCSFTSTFSSSSSPAYVGGVIGHADTAQGYGHIENCVSMASVAFAGNTRSRDLHIGGIAGSTAAITRYTFEMENCANYGTVSISGKSANAYAGGIVGHSYGYFMYYLYTHNNLNYGAIVNSGEAENNLSIGGIAGYSQNNYFENCLNYGRIIPGDASAGNNTFVGSIVGYVDSASSDIKHCFWCNDNGEYEVSGYGYPTVDNATSYAVLGSELVGKLNTRSEGKGWTRWLLNMNNASVSFKINRHKALVLDAQVMVLPSPYRNNSERTFVGWYTDEKLLAPFTASEVVADTKVYGEWVVAMNFDLMNGTAVNSTFPYKEEIVYPDTAREDYRFVGWFLDGNLTKPYENETYAIRNTDLYAKYVKSFSLGLTPLLTLFFVLFVF